MKGIQGLMQDMDDFVKKVHQSWCLKNYEIEAFPDIAFNSLLELEDFEAPGIDFFLDQLSEASLELPVQTYNDAIFSDFPITLARTSKICLDLYYWFNTDTSIHNHHFSGAFKVLKGQSLQLTYNFQEEAKIDEHLLTGEIHKTSDLMLSEGDVFRIYPQDKFIHQIFHLKHLTVTMCLRTIDHQEMNLWGFILPKYKIVYKDFDLNQKKWFQALKNTMKYHPSKVPEILERMPLTAGDIFRIILQSNSGDRPLEPIHLLLLTSLHKKGIGLDFFEMLQSQHKMNQKLKMFGAIS